MASSTQSCPYSQASSCPFLRNFSLSTGADTPSQVNPKDPIFSDGFNFEVAFKAFHGDDGVVPLPRVPLDLASSSNSNAKDPSPSCPFMKSAKPCSAEADVVKPEDFAAALASAPLATIGLSNFGGGGMFGFDAFKDALEARKQRERREEQERQRQRREEQQQDRADGLEAETKPHEGMGDDWLATGNCPIARSYRAFNRVVPALAAAFKPPPGVKYVCPPAIVAMRAEVAKHPVMKILRPQALPIRVLAIGTMGLFLNIPLGAWREHLVKFSPQWILVVHASVPFVAILRKAALMPKYAMAFTVAASIIGQSIGAKLERKRMTQAPPAALGEGELSHSEELTVVTRKASRRELGHGIRGLGSRHREPMVAFDCQIKASVADSYKQDSTTGHAHFAGLKTGADLVTAAA